MILIKEADNKNSGKMLVSKVRKWLKNVMQLSIKHCIVVMLQGP